MINKNEAINKAKVIFAPKLNVFTELYMMPKQVSIKDVMDGVKHPVFPQFSEDIKGWLFFLDKLPFANWSHPCEYLFVIDNETYIGKVHDWPPVEKLELERIIVPELNEQGA